MALPRTFVSFSSTDISYYYLMCAWKSHEDIAFNFADFQLEEAIRSTNPYYIKSVCLAKIRRADTFILLIGQDTYQKTIFVKAEVEAAIEKECRLICVNLNDCRFRDSRCPDYVANKGAIFVPFSSRILATALTSARATDGDWYYKEQFYRSLGYDIVDDTAVLPEPANPFVRRRQLP